jgi:transposase
MDNAAFHRKGKLHALAEKAGCVVIFLPPYSPDLNKIEKYWAWLKGRLRKILPECDDFMETLCGIF